jgi:hypothetical protein
MNATALATHGPSCCCDKDSLKGATVGQRGAAGNLDGRGPPGRGMRRGLRHGLSFAHGYPPAQIFRCDRRLWQLVEGGRTALCGSAIAQPAGRRTRSRTESDATVAQPSGRAADRSWSRTLSSRSRRAPPDGADSTGGARERHGIRPGCNRSTDQRRSGVCAANVRIRTASLSLAFACRSSKG